MQLWGANGLAQGSIFPAMMTLLAACLDKRTRGTVLGLWTTSQQLGGVTSTAFVGYVLQHGGWRAACVRRSLAR
jgi:sugar phosphate permease